MQTVSGCPASVGTAPELDPASAPLDEPTEPELLDEPPPPEELLPEELLDEPPSLDADPATWPPHAAREIVAVKNTKQVSE